MIGEWERQKQQLNASGENLLRTFDLTQRVAADKIRTEFIHTLEEFCRSLAGMNENYLEIVIDRLI
jgi:hypothetical protein